MSVCLQKLFHTQRLRATHTNNNNNNDNRARVWGASCQKKKFNIYKTHFLSYVYMSYIYYLRLIVVDSVKSIILFHLLFIYLGFVNEPENDTIHKIQLGNSMDCGNGSRHFY